MLRSTHDQVAKKILAHPDHKKAYDDLEEEFSLYRQMLKARLEAGKSQDDLATDLQTTRSVISRLENAGGKKKHSPTIATLRKYAKALGCTLDIRFIPTTKHKLQQSRKVSD